MVNKRLIAKYNANAQNNYNNIKSMVELFISYKNTEDLQNMMSAMDIAKKVAGELTICDYTSDYVLKFKAEIMNEDVKTLFNYNYVKLIQSGTINETQKMITQLIDQIRTIWATADELLQCKIKHHVLLMLNYSIKHKQYKERI